MRIFTSAGQYDLPSGFVLELERKNPFFSEISEKSIPVTLPLTSNNKRIIGYNKIDSRFKPVTSIDVLIEDGTTRLFAKQIIHKVTKDGISTTFYPNMGAFWTSIKDKTLKEVMSNYSYTSNTLMSDLQSSMLPESTFDFRVFPVACDNGNDTYWIINETELKDSGGTPYLIGRQARTITEGGTSTNVPIGYGISPYLRMYRLLEIVISHFGYTLENNFLSNDHWKNLCILNSCADIVTIGRIEYSQIVPDIKIQDLLDLVRAKFCCEFIPNETTKTISISFFKDQVTAVPSVDLSQRKVSDFEFDLPSFSQVKILQDTSIENSTTETTTLEKFVEKYGNVGVVTETEFVDQDIVGRYNAVLRLAEASFYAIEYNGTTLQKKRVSSIFFNYDKGGDLEPKEVEIKDTAVPIVEVSGQLMPFVGSVVNLNTAIAVSTGGTKEEKASSGKNCMLCFARFEVVSTLSIAYGTPTNYNNKGIREGEYSLQTWGADGIFHRFYKDMDAFYRHSNVSVQVSMLLSETDKNTVSEIKPVVVDNQIFLPDTMSYTVGKKIEKSCVLRTIRHYEPFNISLEQAIPVLISEHTSPLYYWLYMDDSSEVVPPDGADTYQFRYNGEIVNPPDSPTEAQVTDSTQNGTVYYSNTIQIIIEHFDNQGTLIDDYPATLAYWFVACKK